MQTQLSQSFSQSTIFVTSYNNSFYIAGVSSRRNNTPASQLVLNQTCHHFYMLRMRKKVNGLDFVYRIVAPFDQHF